MGALASFAMPIAMYAMQKFLPDEFRDEAKRVAREGVMSPSEMNVFYRQARSRSLGGANATLNLGRSIAARSGITGSGATNALSRDVASGTAASISNSLANIQQQNIQSRLQGLQMWGNYQQAMWQALGQAMAGAGQSAGAMAAMAA